MKTRDQVVHFPLTHIHTQQSIRRHIQNPPTPISMTFPHDLCLISPLEREREESWTVPNYLCPRHRPSSTSNPGPMAASGQTRL
jgi:hypothetical protein